MNTAQVAAKIQMLEIALQNAQNEATALREKLLREETKHGFCRIKLTKANAALAASHQLVLLTKDEVETIVNSAEAK